VFNLVGIVVRQSSSSRDIAGWADLCQAVEIARRSGARALSTRKKSCPQG